ncbi:MAG: hypothetical protein QM765_53610 [Myxococcales bacterium]
MAKAACRLSRRCAERTSDSFAPAAPQGLARVAVAAKASAAQTERPAPAAIASFARRRSAPPWIAASSAAMSGKRRAGAAASPRSSTLRSRCGALPQPAFGRPDSMAARSAERESPSKGRTP